MSVSKGSASSRGEPIVDHQPVSFCESFGAVAGWDERGAKE